jgi:hypothetical protein
VVSVERLPEQDEDETGENGDGAPEAESEA